MNSRIKKAQKAFRKKDKKLLDIAHTPEAIKKSMQHHEHHTLSGMYVGDAVFGALDGIVTTLAIVAGVTGASLSSGIILILGFANIIADGISMALGNYLGLKSEKDFHKRERAREEWEVEHHPEGEKEEIRQIYASQGLKGKDLDNITNIITSNKELWLHTMMMEELGIIEAGKNPVKAGSVTFVSFFIAGLIPLSVYIISIFIPALQNITLVLTIVVTAIAVFIIGSLRSVIIEKKWWIAGFEMLFVSAIAASAAFGIGHLLGGLIK